MGFLSANVAGPYVATLADMTPACPDRGILKRANVTAGSAGGVNYDWDTATTIAEGFPMNIQSASPREIEDFSRRGIKVSHKVFSPINLQAEQGDRIEIPSRSGQYVVLSFISDMGGMHTAFKAYGNLVN